jgi:hypothetical protein
MSSRAFQLLLLALCAAAAGDAKARVSYLGPGRTPGTAVIDDSERGIREIRMGDVLPDVGAVREIDEREIVFDRPLSDEERAQWRAEGGVTPDIQRLHLYRGPAQHDESTPSSGAATLTAD